MAVSKSLMLTWVCLLVVMVNKYASANSDQEALLALKQSLTDPDNVLESWDSTLVDSCTWFHITCNANRVVRVDLGNYNLAGKLVPELGDLDALQYLELYKNNIEGTIPTELGKLKNLMSLDLYNNKLSGSLPSELGNLKSLNFMRLNDNQLTGEVPKEISSLPNLKVLDLTNNQFIGSVPHLPPNNLKNNPLSRKALGI